MALEIAVYSHNGCEPPRLVPRADLAATLAQPDAVLWVDITSMSEDDLTVLSDSFQFHPLAIEDTHNQRQRPKVEEYAGYLFGIINTVDWRDGEATFDEVDLFAGANYLVTVHDGVEPCVDEAKRRLGEMCQVQPMSTGFLLYVILDAVVDSYFPILDLIGDEIEAIEDNIVAAPQTAHMARLFALKRTLSEMWRVAGQQRDMFGILMRENYHLVSSEPLRYYMRDVYDHLLRISDTVNTFRDTLSNVMDLYLSGVSNRLNQQVNRLTVITMGIGLLAVITGFYGMNFERTWPPFDAVWGVPFVLLLMVLTVGAFLAVVFIMRRR